MNSLVTGKFPVQRPVTWSFDVFFDLHLNKQSSLVLHLLPRRPRRRELATCQVCTDPGINQPRTPPSGVARRLLQDVLTMNWIHHLAVDLAAIWHSSIETAIQDGMNPIVPIDTPVVTMAHMVMDMTIISLMTFMKTTILMAYPGATIVMNSITWWTLVDISRKLLVLDVMVSDTKRNIVFRM